MPELEVADGHVPMQVTHPAAHRRILGVPPMAATRGVIVPTVWMGLQPVAGYPANHVLPIGSIDALVVEMRPVNHLPEFAREDNVRVEIENPVPAADLVNGALNEAILIERPVSRAVFGCDA